MKWGVGFYFSDPVPTSVDDVHGRRSPGLLLDVESVFIRLNPPPLVRAVGGKAFGGTKGQAVLVRLAVARVAPAAPFGDLDEAESDKLAQRCGYAVLWDAVVLELAEGDGQAAVLVAAMVHEFDLKA
jgi:hypothetical protein